MNTHDSKLAERGAPSYVWRAGQERRLAMIRHWGRPQGAFVLEAGVGLGVYAVRLLEDTPHVFGFDIEVERIRETRERLTNSHAAAAEALPYPADSFDLILSNEVIEHVADDRAALAEMARVLRPGGRAVIFCPNRWYPVETHGHYWRGEYHFGNTPLINFLPDPLARRAAAEGGASHPHLRRVRQPHRPLWRRGAAAARGFTRRGTHPAPFLRPLPPPDRRKGHHTMTDHNLLEQLRATARLAALEAGRIVKAQYGQPSQVHYKDARNLVTQADKEAEQTALSIIQARHPGHAILSEEDPASRPDDNGRWPIPDGVTWIVDPIDGTTNFTRQIPFLNVSVGAALDGVPVAGAIYDPVRDELFLAARGLGALLNDRPLNLVEAVPFEQVIVGTEWPGEQSVREHQFDVLKMLSAHCHTLRAFGAAALGIVYVACGRTNLYLHYQLSPWDTCAGAAIASEAGALVAHPEGSSWYVGGPEIMVGHPALVAEAKYLISSL
jgi:fructose-1,6-bisphosphatase/inositol monophosphatase family enzyme/SAM-dependent methyltransferase